MLDPLQFLVLTSIKYAQSSSNRYNPLNTGYIILFIIHPTTKTYKAHINYNSTSGSIIISQDQTPPQNLFRYQIIDEFAISDSI